MKRPLSAVQEVLLLWSVCFGAIVVAQNVIPGYAKLVATAGFLYLPSLAMRRRNEHFDDYGISLKNGKKDFTLAAIVIGIVIPIYILGYVGFIYVLPKLPQDLHRLLFPVMGNAQFHFQLPNRFDEWVIDQMFVVALPEEFFHRGYLQQRLRDAWPKGRIFLGARLGPAFWFTAVLFALGHLAIFQVWRLSVFFPALIFGWMREKTGSVVGAAVFHAVCNLTVMVLNASFFGPT